MNRNFQVIGLIAALVLAPLGCGREEAPSAAPTPSAAPAVRLSFWHIQNKEVTRPVVDQAVGRFRAAHPGVSLDVRVMENDDFKLTLGQAAALGRGFPDVFHTWGGGALADYVQRGFARRFEAEAAGAGVLDRLHPMALSFCRVDGQLAALPADIAVVLMWYNRDLFAAHGVDIPATQAELLAACRTFRRAGVDPIALGNQKAWPGAFFFIYLALRQGGPGPFRRALAGEPGPGFADPSFIEAGRRLQEMVAAEAFPVGFNGRDYPGARRLFFDGRAAMMLMGTWVLGDCLSEAPEFASRLGCFPYPVLDGGAADGARAVLGGVNAAYALGTQSADPAAAFDLVRELAGPEAARAWAGTGRIPALRPELVREMIGEGPTRAATLQALSLLESADFLQLYYDQALPPRLANRHKETTQALFAGPGTMTPEAAAAAMEEERQAR